MRISDWSSDVCSSDLRPDAPVRAGAARRSGAARGDARDQESARSQGNNEPGKARPGPGRCSGEPCLNRASPIDGALKSGGLTRLLPSFSWRPTMASAAPTNQLPLFYHQLEPLSRSEEHTSELQSLMRISYA